MTETKYILTKHDLLCYLELALSEDGEQPIDEFLSKHEQKTCKLVSTDDDINGYGKCSVCGMHIHVLNNYCKECGSRIVENE